MATLCKNCSHALIYDPSVKKMLCTTCGSTFEAEEVESEAKKFREDEKVRRRDEVYGDDTDEAVEEYLENYVYTCSECGGEIVIHGSEASTKCIYCGNPNVVFSRISKEKMPDYIIPFSVTKTQAINAIKRKIEYSRFIPKEIREFEPEDVRGIYIPYWIVEADFEGECIIESKVSNGKSTSTVHTRKRGDLHLSKFPVDGCAILSNESSARLEPFNPNGMKPFDEDYLLGFYSNASDIKYDELWNVTAARAKEIFEVEALMDVRGSSPKIVARSHNLSLLNNYKYAMFPVWFITFTYAGKQHTILVNGQTNKVVCGLPWRQDLFTWMIVGIGAALTVLSFLVFKPMFSVFFNAAANSKSSGEGASKILFFIGAGIATLFMTGVRKMRRVLKQIELTQSTKTFNFVKKRQE